MVFWPRELNLADRALRVASRAREPEVPILAVMVPETG
jgi:hypothetical protein